MASDSKHAEVSVPLVLSTRRRAADGRHTMEILRYVVYNLLSAAAAFRLKDVSSTIVADVAGLAERDGASTNPGGLKHDTRQHGTDDTVKVHGVTETPFPNRSAVVSILLNNFRWQAEHEARVFDTLPTRWCFGSAERRDDITAIVMLATETESSCTKPL